MNLSLDFKHLLLIDCNSSGMSFYLAKETRDLSSIDFSNLTLLKRIHNTDICKMNFLANDELLKKFLNESLNSFDLEQYSLVFLITPGSSDLEKKFFQDVAPFLRRVSFVDRHFFYNFYLLQKRNFSKAKFLVSLFDDCAELSFFDQNKLLSYEKVFLRNLALESKLFLKKVKEKFSFEQADCFYFFLNNLSDKPKTAKLAKYLKMEAIEIDKLC